MISIGNDFDLLVSYVSYGIVIALSRGRNLTFHENINYQTGIYNIYTRRLCLFYLSLYYIIL